MKTPTIAITNVKHAMTRPETMGTRYVPINGSVRPISEPPTNPATAPTAASGATYPEMRLAVGVVSWAITGHSVFGVRQMFFMRSTTVAIEINLPEIEYGILD
jgi:hypothetical protein